VLRADYDAIGPGGGRDHEIADQCRPPQRRRRRGGPGRVAPAQTAEDRPIDRAAIHPPPGNGERGLQRHEHDRQKSRRLGRQLHPLQPVERGQHDHRHRADRRQPLVETRRVAVAHGGNAVVRQIGREDHAPQRVDQTDRGVGGEDQDRELDGDLVVVGIEPRSHDRRDGDVDREGHCDQHHPRGEHRYLLGVALGVRLLHRHEDGTRGVDRKHRRHAPPDGEQQHQKRAQADEPARVAAGARRAERRADVGPKMGRPTKRGLQPVAKALDALLGGVQRRGGAVGFGDGPVGLKVRSAVRPGLGGRRAAEIHEGRRLRARHLPPQARQQPKRQKRGARRRPTAHHPATPVARHPREPSQ
jgi:hypothetical protein